jgi:hypothetical protein
VTLTPVLIIPFMLFAGFFVSTDNIPIFLKEFEYLSIFKYGYTALLVNQFESIITQCTTPATYGDCEWTCLLPDDVRPIGTQPCSPLSQIMKSNGEYPDKWLMIMLLAVIYFVCYMVSWWILSRLSKKFD